MNSRHWLILSLLFVAATPLLAQNGPYPQARKLFYYGWSSRDTIYTRQHWQEVLDSPFDAIGVSIALDRTKPTVGDGATGNMLGWHSWGSVAYPVTQFREAIEDLKVVNRSQEREIFPAVCPATWEQGKGFNWFDDARWQIILGNWKTLLTIAKEGGCKGLLLDFEHYDYKPELFRYVQQRDEVLNKPFDEYRAQVRQRGRSMGEAMAQIYPDMTLLMLYAWGMCQYDANNFRGKPREETRYSLLPDFLDGLLEGSSPQNKIVDLWEFAYGYTDRAQFLDGYHTVKNKALSWTTLPDRYRAQVQCGFGIFLDNAGRWSVEDFSKNYFSPAKLTQSLQTAMELSDGYVWMYSQNPGFFPPKDLPDEYLQAIRAAKPAPAPQ